MAASLGVMYQQAPASLLIYTWGAVNQPILHLFVSNSTPGTGDNPSAQYTEASGVNYAPLSMGVGYLQLVQINPPLYAIEGAQFVNVGPLSTGHDTVFGWWIDQPTPSSPTALFGGRFSSPVVLNAAGQSLVFDSIALPLQDCGMGPFIIPSGTVLLWPVSALPAGFLYCDGSYYSTTLYPNLFALLGNTFNTFRGQPAPPAGNFRVPLYNGLAPICAGVGSSSPTTSTRSITSTVGEETHRLTSTEIPSTTLNIAGVSFLDTITGLSNTPVAGDGGGGGGSLSSWQVSGGNTPHNNMQPAVVMNFIIKT